MNIRKFLSCLAPAAVLAISVATGSAIAEDAVKAGNDENARAAELAALRKEIDAESQEALDELLQSHEGARTLYQDAKGYAVFRAAKAGLILTGGGGTGVAVDKQTGERTYMRMGTGGVGVGAGVQKFRLIVLFESADVLQRFVDGGWDSAVSAQAAAGKAGTNAASSFADGIAVYQLTDKGLMAQADLTGTRFWASDELNL